MASFVSIDRTKEGVAVRLGILFGIFFVGLLAVSFISPTAQLLSLGERGQILYVSVWQSLLAFIFPALATAMITSCNPLSYLGIKERTGWHQFLAVFILLIISFPLINFLVDWNSRVSFPASMTDFEVVLREWEQRAEETTKVILGDSSFGALVSGILVVGILTGIAEESFFRAGVQKSLLSGGCNRHIAIWLSALLFSAMHFQFFGFIPRLLLGAMFGYIYYTTGSLWLSAFAHALNNSSVVVAEWLLARGFIQEGPETLGVDGKYAKVWLISSIILTTIFLIFFWKRWLAKKQNG